MALSVAVIAGLTGMLIASIAARDGLTSGDRISWDALAALVGFASAVAGAATLAVLLQSLPDVERSAQSAEIERSPYLRIDLAFEEREAQQRGLQLPVPSHIYTLEEMNTGGSIAFPPGVLADGHEAGWRLVLWVTNLQTTALGIADDVRVSAVLGSLHDDEEPVFTTFEIRLAYVASRQTTAVEIGRIKRSADSSRSFFAQIVGVQYQDRYGHESIDTHGALTLMYSDSKVVNERGVIRAKGRPASRWSGSE